MSDDLFENGGILNTKKIGKDEYLMSPQMPKDSKYLVFSPNLESNP